MTAFPETRASLILRIADAADAEAWEEFARVYRPIVYRLAQRGGMQHADAEELSQEVMLAVARGVSRWVPDQRRGRFRHWLVKVAQNLRINFATRPKYQRWGSGDSHVQSLLESQPGRECGFSRLFELEYRRAIFKIAAQKVQQTVTDRTWQAFWRTTIEDHDIARVAGDLGMTPGSVYIARNRVMARLRVEVGRIEADSEMKETT